MRKISILLIFLLGAAIRVVYLLTPDLDSDQAIMGLMGRHILNGEFPIFYWGENYEGPIESYLASITFYLFGSSRITLALSPFIFSLIFLILIYRLAKEMFDEKVAIITLSLASVSPPFLIWYSIIPNGNYIENLVFGTLLLLITYRFVTKVRDEKTALRFYVVIGFVSGLAWWVNFQIIHFLLTALIFMPLKDRWQFIKRGLLYSLPSFMAGSSLFWYYNIKNHWASILDIHRYSERLKLSDSLTLFFNYKIPWVFGPFAESDIWHFNKYFLIIYGIAFLYFIYSNRKAILGIFMPSLKEARGAEILIVFFFIFSVIVIGFYNTGSVIRYYLPLYSVIPIVLAYLIARAGKIFRYLPVLLMVLFISSNIYGDIKGAVIFDSKKFSDYKEGREWEGSFFDFLEKKGLRYVAEIDYWKSFRLTFDASERVIFALPTEDWHPNKYPGYTEGLNSFKDPAYMWRRDSSNFERILRAQGITYTKENFRDYFLILHSLKMPAIKGGVISPLNMIVSSNYDEVSPNNAIDRDVTSAWYPKENKGEKVYFEIDMKRPYLINKVSILNGGDFGNNPGGYELEVSLDKERWVKIISLPVSLGCFVSREGIPVLEGGCLVSVFDPVRARYIRIKQIENQPSMNWHIAEIFIYSPSESMTEDSRNPSYLLGLKYYKDKKWERAMIEFLNVIKGNPDSEDSHYHLWLIAKRLGIKTGAYSSVLLNRLIRIYEKEGETEKADLLRKRLAEDFSPGEKREINFGGLIEFLGYDIKYGNLPEIIYYWKALSKIKRDWHAFVHFIGPDGRIAFQNDHILSSGDRRSSEWVKGEIYKERIKIDIPQGLPSGTYLIRIGIWDPKTEKRLKVKENLLKERDAVDIGELRITGG